MVSHSNALVSQLYSRSNTQAEVNQVVPDSHRPANTAIQPNVAATNTAERQTNNGTPIREENSGEQKDNIPKFLKRVNSSLFAKATAKQIFMVELDIEKKKQNKLKSLPKDKDNQRIKSDRFVKIAQQQTELFKPKRAGLGTSPAAVNTETLAYLNSQVNWPLEKSMMREKPPKESSNDWRLSGDSPASPKVSPKILEQEEVNSRLSFQSE